MDVTRLHPDSPQSTFSLRFVFASDSSNFNSNIEMDTEVKKLAQVFIAN